jgi:ParB/RepB/Spo0J family partition protein
MAVRRVPVSKCKVWNLHVRSEESINTASCASLIKSMRKHGQRLPVLARQRTCPEGTEFELIYGARRLFAAQQLGIELLVDVRDIDDRNAVIEMEVENRPRQDISAYERGVNYSRWLRAGYFKNQVELAKELGLSETRVSRLLRYAELPAVVVGAFNSVRDIKEAWAVRLANICRDPKLRSDVMRRARERAAAPRKDSPQSLYDALLRGAGADVIGKRARDQVITSASGRPLFRVAFRSDTLHVILPRAGIASDAFAEITRHIKKVLEQYGSQATPAARRAECISHRSSTSCAADTGAALRGPHLDG